MRKQLQTQPGSILKHYMLKCLPLSVLKQRWVMPSQATNSSISLISHSTNNTINYFFDPFTMILNLNDTLYYFYCRNFNQIVLLYICIKYLTHTYGTCFSFCSSWFVNSTLFVWYFRGECSVSIRKVEVLVASWMIYHVVQFALETLNHLLVHWVMIWSWR